MTEVVNWLGIYGWIGIAVFAALIVLRACKFMMGGELVPRPDDPWLGKMSAPSLVLIVLAACVVAWPAVVCIFLSENIGKGRP